jgi:hypothetical protein
MKAVAFSILFLLTSFYLHAQIGIKAGPNFANITKAGEINSTSETGYHFGLFFEGPVKKFLSSDTELLYSKQGYNYETSENTGQVNLDYLFLHQLLVLNFTEFVQVQAGFHLAYLLSAKVDSTQVSTGNSSTDKIIDLLNRFDYGLGGGVEIHPIYQIVAGARINFSLGQLYKEPDESGEIPPFVPDIDAKNNLFQLYVGLKFGNEDK